MAKKKPVELWVVRHDTNYFITPEEPTIDPDGDWTMDSFVLDLCVRDWEYCTGIVLKHGEYQRLSVKPVGIIWKGIPWEEDDTDVVESAESGKTSQRAF